MQVKNGVLYNSLSSFTIQKGQLELPCTKSDWKQAPSYEWMLLLLQDKIVWIIVLSDCIKHLSCVQWCDLCLCLCLCPVLTSRHNDSASCPDAFCVSARSGICAHFRSDFFLFQTCCLILADNLKPPEKSADIDTANFIWKHWITNFRDEC